MIKHPLHGFISSSKVLLKEEKDLLHGPKRDLIQMHTSLWKGLVMTFKIQD